MTTVPDHLPQKLSCPTCGYEYLSHENVTVFSREQEDAGKGVRVSVSGVRVAIDTALTGNPSLRRDGISILFRCENCPALALLTIAQHKGQTRLEFRQDGTQEDDL